MNVLTGSKILAHGEAWIRRLSSYKVPIIRFLRTLATSLRTLHGNILCRSGCNSSFEETQVHRVIVNALVLRMWLCLLTGEEAVFDNRPVCFF